MPAKSQAQRGFLFATKGSAWAKRHHFDNPGPLPKYVDKKKQIHEAAVADMKRRR